LLLIAARGEKIVMSHSFMCDPSCADLHAPMEPAVLSSRQIDIDFDGGQVNYQISEG
jgi:hypothetical protein